MHKILRWTSLAILLAGFGALASAQGQTQSLAEAARAARKNKPPVEHKTWTNENISSVPPALATEGSADTTSSTDAEAKKECDKTKDAECEKAAADAKPASETSKSKAESYKKQLDELQKAAAELEKEASLNEREWKLSQAAFYGDAGTQLRDQKKFAENQAAHQKDTDRLQKAIQEAQKKISDLKEQARKDGVNL